MLTKELAAFTDIRAILQRHCAADTAYDSRVWKDSKCVMRGHCFAVAYTLREIFGGDILVGKVNGERHAWNCLPGGVEIDLTSDQFGGDGYSPLTTGRRWVEGNKVNSRFRLFYSRVIGEIRTALESV